MIFEREVIRPNERVATILKIANYNNFDLPCSECMKYAFEMDF